MPNVARTLIIFIVVTAAALSAALPASAATRSVRASRVEAGIVVFKLHGKFRPKTIGSAALRVGRYHRRLAARRVRRAARRGRLMVKLPRRLQPAAGRTSPRLIVNTVPPVQTPARRGSPDCSIPSDATYVSPGGSDANSGTADRPWRTLDKAESGSGPGSTVVLRGGAYGASGSQILMGRDGTDQAPISWVAQPGETPVLRGQVAIEGDHRRLCGLHLEGPSGNVTPGNDGGEEVKLFIGGNDVEVARSEITGSRWHAGIYLNGASGFRLIDNYIHDNGRFDDPSHANLDHGIYVGDGSGLIEGNRIEHNVAHAVQLYPHARGVTVRGNEMSGNGRAAVMIAEDASDNVIVDNRIYDNRAGVQTWSLRGRGNVVRSNQLWNNRDGNFVATDGLLLQNNESL